MTGVDVGPPQNRNNRKNEKTKNNKYLFYMYVLNFGFFAEQATPWVP